jgi:rod shape-determining protein MreD
MAESQTARNWAGQMAYVFICLVIIFAQLLPLSTEPQRFAAPDMMVALTITWVVRRPDLVPVPMIAALFLLSDFLSFRPPGLWTLLMLITTEILRRRAVDMRSLAFPAEWLTITAAITGLFIAYRAAVMIFLLPQEPLIPTLWQMTATVLVIPFVAVISHYFLGVSRPGLGEIDEMGRRL